MLSNILGMSIGGIEGELICVEVDINTGLPSWEIVGLPDTSVRESKERVRTAIKNSGFELQSRKIVINLSPASTRKEGSAFDLPIAIGILNNIGEIECHNINEYVFIGELSLDGRINKINGVLPMCVSARNLGVKNIVVPYENKEEAGVVNGIRIIPAKNLKEIVDHLNNHNIIDRYETDTELILQKNEYENIDFSEIKGQEFSKRALEIVAAGAHNCLMIGSPGVGKTMLAKRLRTILPDLTFEEALEITKIHSVAGVLPANTPLIVSRPFRAPHHTATGVALAGGGRIPKPGEISLAHYGVLYLDEIAEFDRSALEVMRSPIEEGKITISRMNNSYTYPCNFIFIASMNPCPCGYAMDSKKRCVCTESQIQRYFNKISGPLLDRIDIHIEVPAVCYDKLNDNNKKETSAQIRERVNNARKIQKERYKDYGIFSNSELTDHLINKFCKLENDANELLKQAFIKYGFSVRTHNRIIKVARTIADLEESENIKLEHIAEAIQYRILDKNYIKKEY